MVIDDSTLLVFGFLGLLIQFLIIYFAIRWATEPVYQTRLLRMQIDLLVKIAKKHGVTDEEISETYGLK